MESTRLWDIKGGEGCVYAAFKNLSNQRQHF